MLLPDKAPGDEDWILMHTYRQTSVRSMPVSSDDGNHNEISVEHELLVDKRLQKHHDCSWVKPPRLQTLHSNSDHGIDIASTLPTRMLDLK